MKVVTLNFCLSPAGGNMKYGAIYYCVSFWTLILSSLFLLKGYSFLVKVSIILSLIQFVAPLLAHLLSAL